MFSATQRKKNPVFVVVSNVLGVTKLIAKLVSAS